MLEREHSVVLYYSTHPHSPLLTTFSLYVCVQCRGTARWATDMTFVAQPSHVLSALNGMRYMNSIEGFQDRIYVTIYDGEVSY